MDNSYAQKAKLAADVVKYLKAAADAAWALRVAERREPCPDTGDIDLLRDEIKDAVSSAEILEGTYKALVP